MPLRPTSGAPSWRRLLPVLALSLAPGLALPAAATAAPASGAASSTSRPVRVALEGVLRVVAVDSTAEASTAGHRASGHSAAPGRHDHSLPGRSQDTYSRCSRSGSARTWSPDGGVRPAPGCAWWAR